jgi:hypothetical protein
MEKDELQLFLRIGNLIDATVQAARGLANVGDQQSRTPAAGIPVPQNIKLTPVLDGIDINFDAVEFDNLAHYEIDIDVSSVFSDPVTKKAFSNKFVIRWLDSGVFFVRIRVVDRTGKVGEYSDTEEVTLGDAGFDEDTDFFLPEQRHNSLFNNETVSKSFFTNSGDNALVAAGVSSGPGRHNRRISWGEGSGAVDDPNTALLHLHVMTLEEDETILEDQARGFGHEQIRNYFYTYGHNPDQGFDSFYNGPDPDPGGFTRETQGGGGKQPAFYAVAYIGGPSMYTIINFFNVDQSNEDGPRFWDVTHGDDFVVEGQQTQESESATSWMMQTTVKF